MYEFINFLKNDSETIYRKFGLLSFKVQMKYKEYIQNAWPPWQPERMEMRERECMSKYSNIFIKIKVVRIIAYKLIFSNCPKLREISMFCHGKCKQ